MPLSEPEERRREFVTLLIDFFDGHDKTLSFLKGLITQEVEKTTHSATILREESYASMFLRHYFRTEIGKRYLKKLLGEFVEKVYAMEKPLQINPSLTATKDEADRNLKIILVLAHELLETIFASELSCPIGYRQILSHLKNKLTEKFADFDHVLIGAYFFLSYVCPAIIQPHQVDIMSTQPSPGTQTGLITTSKLLQNLANGSHFPSHSPFANELNKFIDDHTKAMRRFLEVMLDRESIHKYKMIINANRTNSSSRISYTYIKSLAVFIVNFTSHPNSPR
jgi:hypothetical protein